MPKRSETLRPTDRFKGKDLGDEYLFYDTGADRVHVLNGAARTIFLLCDGRRSEAQICEAFAEASEVEPATARQDAAETLRRLVELGVLAQE